MVSKEVGGGGRFLSHVTSSRTLEDKWPPYRLIGILIVLVVVWIGMVVDCPNL